MRLSYSQIVFKSFFGGFMVEVLLDALKDTAILAIYIFLACLVIEFIEQNAMRSLKVNKLLTGKMAPLMSATVGIIPQCGFSAVATKLYAKRHIQLGSLIAVYIATSDEAIPIFMAHPDKIWSLLPVLGIKFVFALIVGFSLNAILLKWENKRLVGATDNSKHIDLSAKNTEKLNYVDFENGVNALSASNSSDASISANGSFGEVHSHDDDHAREHDHDEEFKVENPCGDRHCEKHEHDIGCCGHHIGCENPKYIKFVTYFVHPLIHTLKIVLFVFIVNFLFGTALYFLGEEKLMSFMLAQSIFQPFVVALVGLIPNCAASVVITELYVMGGLSLGSLIAGLSVNAGIAFVILFKENKHLRENILIVAGLYLISSLLGVVVFAIENAIV